MYRKNDNNDDVMHYSSHGQIDSYNVIDFDAKKKWKHDKKLMGQNN